MPMVRILDEIASVWNRALKNNRDLYFVLILMLSACVAFLPFARESAASNFFVYALLPIVLVYANKRIFESVPGPSGAGFALGAGIVAASFAFNFVFDIGGQGYGLTDYVLLVVGLFLLVYSVSHPLVQFGVAVLVVLRVLTLALSYASESVFVSVSGALVKMVVFFSRILVSPEITSGTVDGEILVGGAAQNSSVFIGWACAGLEELVLIAVILYVLIDSFKLTRVRAILWLAIGVVGSFIVNIVRMVILVWVAYSQGIVDMLWVHTHLGDFLFLVWIGVFWILFFKIALRKTERPKEEVSPS